MPHTGCTGEDARPQSLLEAIDRLDVSTAGVGMSRWTNRARVPPSFRLIDGRIAGRHHCIRPAFDARAPTTSGSTTGSQAHGGFADGRDVAAGAGNNRTFSRFASVSRP
ncbi:hypothetical protein F2981_00680 [Sinorhizobium meliloti]|nr:hypothetical protein [Sinorhizobium meliloti]